MFAGCLSSGFQNVVSLIQQASFSTRSLKPKAWNISIVRQAMPSAWPSSIRPGFCSTMQVLMSGNADNCAASVSPAGPQPTIRTSTSAGTEPCAPEAGYRSDGSEISGSPGSNPFEMKLHDLLLLLSILMISILVNLSLAREAFVKAINEMPGHLARRFQQIAVAVFLAEVEGAGYDLTPVQYAALAAVGANPGIDQVTLAGLIAFDRTTITGVVDRLVQKGLITRQESSRDRRARELTMTVAGRRTLRRHDAGG